MWLDLWKFYFVKVDMLCYCFNCYHVESLFTLSVVQNCFHHLCEGQCTSLHNTLSPQPETPGGFSCFYAHDPIYL